MCGIVGYIGNQNAEEILLEGLMKLEYRGYDSSGVATLCRNPSSKETRTHIRRSSGKLAALRSLLKEHPCPGTSGIGHTRWATHGKPTNENAHPHKSGTITVVHNGIIENHFQLKEEMRALGRQFESDTDTEVVAHLIDAYRNTKGLTFKEAVLAAANRLHGAFALAISDEKEPNKLLAVKQACPLVIGVGNEENFIASDYSALLNHTNRFIILEDGQIAEVAKNKVHIHNFEGKEVSPQVETLDWTPLMAEKEGHKHFMHKEIFEQPRALIDTLRGRYNYDNHAFELDSVDADSLKDIERILIVACGTSYYAGMVGRYIFESIAKIPVEFDLASELRYRDLVIDKKTLVLGISQSGETADTLAALKFAQKKGATILGICNVISSAVARLCNQSAGTIYTRAGPEISVASTKAFSSQLMVLNILALYLSQLKGHLGNEDIQNFVDQLSHLPVVVESQLSCDEHIRDIAKLFLHSKSMLYLGRGVAFPVAMEGALKMKELSYIHAEGFAAGELKHGPIALIDSETPVIAIAFAGRHFDKMISNIQEVHSRGGKVIAITDQPCDQLKQLCEHLIEVPKVPTNLGAIVATVPLQLLAYHLAELRGLDVDQPRNLAKSVTVE